MEDLKFICIKCPKTCNLATNASHCPFDDRELTSDDVIDFRKKVE